MRERKLARILVLATVALLAAAACGPVAASPVTATVAPVPRAATPQILDDTVRPEASRAEGTVEQDRFDSVLLGRTMPYWLYLPDGYERSARRYPVLYMLHGMAGSYDEWRSYGIFDAADRLIRSGSIAPLIIVLPQGDREYWVDHAGGGAAWGRYTAQELVAAVDSRYRTIPQRSGRAIGGISMGGHGAFQLALNYPDTFGVVGAHSIALRRASSAPTFFGDATEYADRDPMALVRTRTPLARSLQLWVDIGDQDPWAPLARQFHGELEQLGIQHDWREWRGDHSATYWKQHLDDYLRFYDTALARCAAASDPTAITR